MKSFRISGSLGLLHIGGLLCGILFPDCAKALVCYECGIITKGPTNSKDPCYDPRRTAAAIKVCDGRLEIRLKGATDSSATISTQSSITGPTEAPTSRPTPVIDPIPPMPNYDNYVDVCVEAYWKIYENDTSNPFLYRGCDFVDKSFKTCEKYSNGQLYCHCNQRNLCNDEVAYQFGLTIGKDSGSFKNSYGLLGFTIIGSFQLLL